MQTVARKTTGSGFATQELNRTSGPVRLRKFAYVPEQLELATYAIDPATPLALSLRFQERRGHGVTSQAT